MGALLPIPLFLTIHFIYVIFVYRKSWQYSSRLSKSDLSPLPFVSIIIVARNEERHIRRCIYSILKNTYERKYYEIIVVNDHSEDQTMTILQEILTHNNDTLIDLGQYTLHEAQNAKYKKLGIQYAVNRSKGKYLLFTDADSEVEEKWITSMVNYAEKNNCDMVSAPVKIYQPSSFIEWFQAYDFMGNMAMTNYGFKNNKHILANGSNLLIRKSIYPVHLLSLSNFSSGDDVFIAQHLGNHPSYTSRFLIDEDCVVSTHALCTWNDLVQQRLRWATKTSAYDEFSFKLRIFLLFLFSLIISVSIGMGLVYPIFIAVTIGLICIKAVIDWILLKKVTPFYYRDKSITIFGLLPYSFLNALFLSLVGILSLFKKRYTWKGRITQ